jgi:glycosyltransferase involved in cell wall biosynthesis
MPEQMLHKPSWKGPGVRTENSTTLAEGFSRQEISKELTRQRHRVFLMTESLNVGGTERQFVLTAGALDEAFDVLLGCHSRRGPLLDAVGSITEFDTGNSLLSLQTCVAIRNLARHLKTNAVQIAHSFDFYSNMVLIPAARAAGTTVVIGSHRGIGNVFSRAQQFSQALMFRLADRIVCNCEAAVEGLVKYGVPREKTIVIPNIVPVEAFAPCPPALPKIGAKLRIGMVARMNDPVKNYPLLLRGVARLVTQYGNIEAVLVGDGPLRAELETLASDLGISNKVLFLGERRDVSAVMRSLDIAALTSDSEGLSNAILEAMAAGLPVIATRVGGNVELVEDGRTGLLFPAGSDEAFAASVAMLAENPELRAQMGMEARNRAFAKYQLSSVVDQFRNLYTSLLRTKGVAAE